MKMAEANSEASEHFSSFVSLVLAKLVVLCLFVGQPRSGRAGGRARERADARRSVSGSTLSPWSLEGRLVSEFFDSMVFSGNCEREFAAVHHQHGRMLINGSNALSSLIHSFIEPPYRRRRRCRRRRRRR